VRVPDFLIERLVRIIGCHRRSLASVTPEKYMSKWGEDYSNLEKKEIV
jgi:hypothetical protein